mmetsp:Transcript_38128/g.68923  ORF Transcript_38128/g.68923 Transcript_38128/m.68923 type:complete len:229 (+) Transcript_38128:1611-2297(+)
MAARAELLLSAEDSQTRRIHSHTLAVAAGHRQNRRPAVGWPLKMPELAGQGTRRQLLSFDSSSGPRKWEKAAQPAELRKRVSAAPLQEDRIRLLQQHPTGRNRGDIEQEARHCYSDQGTPAGAEQSCHGVSDSALLWPCCHPKCPLAPWPRRARQAMSKALHFSGQCQEPEERGAQGGKRGWPAQRPARFASSCLQSSGHRRLSLRNGAHAVCTLEPVLGLHGLPCSN